MPDAVVVIDIVGEGRADVARAAAEEAQRGNSSHPDAQTVWKTG